MSAVHLIGIDVATRSERTGMAVGILDQDTLHVQFVAGQTTPGDLINALDDARGPALVCLDAPLGWPVALAPALTGHEAGQRLDVPRDELFWRRTDHVVREVTGKRPLSVAADLIAHTAWAALSILHRMRADRPLPVLSDPGQLNEAGGAIEVYPGAALVQLGVAHRGYKRAAARDLRQQLLADLRPHGLRLAGPCAEAAVESADALDAALCLLIGARFLQGRCVHWRDHGVAPGRLRREGWIWVPQADAAGG